MEPFIQNRRHLEGSRGQDHQQTGLPVDKLTCGQDNVNEDLQTESLFDRTIMERIVSRHDD
jgi:hypothetical protein